MNVCHTICSINNRFFYKLGDGFTLIIPPRVQNDQQKFMNGTGSGHFVSTTKDSEILGMVSCSCFLRSNLCRVRKSKEKVR